MLSTFPVPTGISKSCSDVHVLTMYTYNIECVETRSHRCYAYDCETSKSFRLLSMDSGRSDMDRGQLETASHGAIQDKTLSE